MYNKMSCNVDPSEQLHNCGGIRRLCSKDGAGWEEESALRTWRTILCSLMVQNGATHDMAQPN